MKSLSRKNLFFFGLADMPIQMASVPVAAFLYLATPGLRNSQQIIMRGHGLLVGGQALVLPLLRRVDNIKEAEHVMVEMFFEAKRILEGQPA